MMTTKIELLRQSFFQKLYEHREMLELRQGEISPDDKSEKIRIKIKLAHVDMMAENFDTSLITINELVDGVVDENNSLFLKLFYEHFVTVETHIQNHTGKIASDFRRDGNFEESDKLEAEIETHKALRLKFTTCYKDIIGQPPKPYFSKYAHCR
jgi:hypothetical protein